MKALNIPIFKREISRTIRSDDAREEPIRDLSSFYKKKDNNNFKTIESFNSSFDYNIIALKKNLAESERKIESLKLQKSEKEAVLLDLSLKMNLNHSSKNESYFDAPKSKRNSHSSFNTVSTAVQHNSVSTLDSPSKNISKDVQLNSFKRKKEEKISEDKNLNKELSNYMKEKNDFIVKSKEEIEEMNEKYSIKQRENSVEEKRKYKEKIEQFSNEHNFLLDSLNTEKNLLEVKLNKISEGLISVEEHHSEIDKLSSLNLLKKKFLVEKIKYYQLLLAEKKSNDVTILSNREEQGNPYFTTTSNIEFSDFNTNPHIVITNHENSNTVKRSKAFVDKSMEDFFMVCYSSEKENKVGLINIFPNFFKK